MRGTIDNLAGAIALLVHRHQPAQPLRGALAAGLGGAMAIAVLGALSAVGPVALLAAPFGATCVLVFAVPASPLSQPANVIGGHVVAAATGLALRAVLPDVWWAAALAVGVAIALMGILRVTHPPAGANPLVIFAADPEFGFLAAPVLAGAVLIVAVAVPYHRLRGTAYPMRPAGPRA